MKSNSVNLGFSLEQWLNHIKSRHTTNDKMRTELSSVLSEDISKIIHNIFSPDSLVMKNLKSSGGNHEVHSHE